MGNQGFVSFPWAKIKVDLRNYRKQSSHRRFVYNRKSHLPNPRSGRASEVVFTPQKVADRLRGYIAAENILDDKRIFPLGYTRAREMVKNAGKKIGIDETIPCTP